MKTNRVCKTVLAGLLALGPACPQVLAAPPLRTLPTVKAAAPVPAPAIKTAVPVRLPAPVAPRRPLPAAAPVSLPAPLPAAVIDPKSVEGRLIAVQGQITAGNLDAGLKALAEVRAKAAPALAPRMAFVEKLVAIRVADRLGDPAKVLTGLAEALKQAAQRDQVAAVFHLGLNLAQAAVTAKGSAAGGLIDFLAAKAAPALQQFGPHLEVAKLRIAANQAAAAEAELAKAAPRIASPQDRTAWASTVAELAKLVDGGQAPQAGADLFERLRKRPDRCPCRRPSTWSKAGPCWPAESCRSARRCSTGDGRREDGQGAVPAGARAGLRSGRGLPHGAATWRAPREALAEAEAMALALPPSPEATATRCKGLVADGQADSAAEIAWNAAVAAKKPAEREQMLMLYVPATVAANREGEVLAKLQAMKAPAGIFTAAAGVLTEAGKAEAAMAVVEAVPPLALTADAKAAGEVAAVVQRIHQQHQKMALRQAARCLAIAAEYATAAKKAKDVKTAAAHAKQAAAFLALAAQLQEVMSPDSPLK